jgi:hypothetical protein
MGNINYNNFICENYYCQSVSFKPEWFSETTWTINYVCNKKPYIIDKGILKIVEATPSQIMLSKKLLINFNEIRNISIPIIFKYNLLKLDSNNIDIFILFSNRILNIDDMNNLNNLNKQKDDNEDSLLPSSLFYIHLNLLKNIVYINHSFDTKIVKKKIKSKKANIYDITLENNFEMLLLTEKISKSNEEKYIINYSFTEDKEYYLNIFVKNNGIKKKEFIELAFE